MTAQRIRKKYCPNIISSAGGRPKQLTETGKRKMVHYTDYVLDYR